MKKAISSFGAKAALTIIGGLALQPVITHAEVMPIVVQGAQVLALVLPASASALAAGYVHHRLQLWRATRPALQPEVQAYAFTPASGPRLANEAAQLLYEEQQAEGDDLVRDRLIQFAFLGHRYGFGWRAMCAYTGRRDWQNCVVTMQGAGVLTNARGNVAPQWAPPWRYSQFRIAVKWRGLPLPYPDGEPAPAIDWRKWLHVTQ